MTKTTEGIRNDEMNNVWGEPKASEKEIIYDTLPDRMDIISEEDMEEIKEKIDELILHREIKELKEEIKDELKEETEELKEEIKEQLKEEIKDEMMEEIRQEITEELRDEIMEETKDVTKDDEDFDFMGTFKDVLDDFTTAMKTGNLEDFGEVVEDIVDLAQNGEAIWGEVQEFLENVSDGNDMSRSMEDTENELAC